MTLKRSSTLNFLLLIAIIYVGFRIYQLWGEPLITLSTLPEKPVSLSTTLEKQRSFKPRALNIAPIIKKNLFDPERGRGPVKQTEAPSVSEQTVQKFILLGTLITPSGRHAIIKVPENLGGGVTRGKTLRSARKIKEKTTLRRVDVGARIGGFELAEIQPRKVIFMKGSERIELVLDFTRKVEEVKRPPRPAAKPASKTRARKATSKTPRRRTTNKTRRRGARRG